MLLPLAVEGIDKALATLVSGIGLAEYAAHEVIIGRERDFRHVD